MRFAFETCEKGLAFYTRFIFLGFLNIFGTLVLQHNTDYVVYLGLFMLDQ